MVNDPQMHVYFFLPYLQFPLHSLLIFLCFSLVCCSELYAMGLRYYTYLLLYTKGVDGLDCETTFLRSQSWSGLGGHRLWLGLRWGGLDYIPGINSLVSDLFLWRRDLYEMTPNKCLLYVCMYVCMYDSVVYVSTCDCHLKYPARIKTLDP